MAIEIIEPLMQLTITNPIVVSVAIAAVRSIAGALQNAAKSWKNKGRIEGFNLGKFLETIPRVFIQELGLSAATGVPGISFITDYAFKTLKKKK